MESYLDPDIEQTFEWFISFMSPEGWAARKKAIEAAIEQHFKVAEGHVISEFTSLPLTIPGDQIGWYLYLIETLQKNLLRYEPTQGARIAPIFKRIGENFDAWQAIGGVKKKTRDLVQKDRNAADATLFEMLTALLWQRNGWQVAFVEEAPPFKRPDLLAVKDTERWHIECKRLMPTSAYHEREREKWNTLVTPVHDLLLAHGVVLDIVFHVELPSLPDDFLVKQLVPALPSLKQEGILFSDETWEVAFQRVDYRAINHHLAFFRVRNGGSQLAKLIGGYTDSNRSFSYGTDAQYSRQGEGKGFDVFVDSLRRAYGVFWSCDAEEAISNRARDFFKQMSNARDQLPDNEKSVIHVGIETYNGAAIEQRRFEKILENMDRVDLKGKPIHWINCNFFQSYAPPEMDWTTDESQFQFKHIEATLPDPLPEKMILGPWGDTLEAMHWDLPQP